MLVVTGALVCLLFVGYLASRPRTPNAAVAAPVATPSATGLATPAPLSGPTQILKIDVATGRSTTLFTNPRPPSDGRSASWSPITTEGFERDGRVWLTFLDRTLILAADGTLLEERTGEASTETHSRFVRCAFGSRCSPNGAWGISMECSFSATGARVVGRVVTGDVGGRRAIEGSTALCGPGQSDARGWDVTWSASGDWARVTSPSLQYLVSATEVNALPYLY